MYCGGARCHEGWHRVLNQESNAYREVEACAASEGRPAVVENCRKAWHAARIWCLSQPCRREKKAVGAVNSRGVGACM